MTGNPFVSRVTGRIGRLGRESERRLSGRLPGRATPASGGLEGAKGDHYVDDYMVEAKATSAASMTLKRDWLDKVSREARSAGKTPALAVTFVTGNGSPRKSGAWVMVPEWRFRELLEDNK